MINIKGNTYVVTGATSGIGLEIARQIILHGGHVIGLGRDGLLFEELISDCNDSNNSFYKIDLSINSQIDSFVENCPKVDGIVHSAGIVKNMSLKFFDFSEYQRIMNVNLSSIVYLLTSLLRKKKLNSASSSVFISSISGINAMKGNSPYSMSKSALVLFSKSLAVEFASKNMRFNTVSPGMVETNITKEARTVIGEEAIKSDEKKYPLGYGSPKDVALPVIFLLSDYSRWITGQNIILDGGRTVII